MKQVQLHQDDYSIKQLESQKMSKSVYLYKLDALKDLQTEKLVN